MFPLRNDVTRRRAPLAVVFLIVINCYVFWKLLFLGPDLGEAVLKSYGLIPLRDFSSGSFFSLHSWMPYVTSMFLHGGFFHLFANMWTLWIFGASVESEMSSLHFSIFYFACGIAAAVAHVYLNPLSTIPVVGASGAISGVMGAYLLMFPRSRIKMFTLLIFYPIVFEIPAFVFLIMWFIGQLLAVAAQSGGTATATAAEGGVAFAAHIGGFVAGMVFWLIFRIKRAR